MAQYPSSGSLIEPGISSGLSTHITVKVGPTTVGAIQQLTISQNREIAVYEEIGTDGVVDSHPKNAAKIELQVQRIVFDQLRLPEAFARGFINIHSQRLPFNVEIIDRGQQTSVGGQVGALGGALGSLGLEKVSAGLNAAGKTISKFENLLGLPDTRALVHVFHNCWFKSYSPTFAANNFVITEQATITAEYVTSHREGTSAARGGLRGIPLDYDTVERSTDVHGSRGSLDTAGANDILGE